MGWTYNRDAMASKAHDDRGRVVVLCRTEDLPAEGRRAETLWRRHYWAWALVFALTLQLLLKVVVGIVRGNMDWPAIAAGSSLVFIGLLIGIFISVMLRPQRGFKKQFLADMKEHGLCAACGYDLGGVQSAIDGCTVCPECAAAWRFPEADSGAGS